MIKKITFTEEQIAELKREKDYNEFPHVRKKCEVVRLKSQNYKNKQTEKIVGISHGTVTDYLRLYRTGHIDALKKSVVLKM